jgi:hypothetical protein
MVKAPVTALISGIFLTFRVRPDTEGAPNKGRGPAGAGTANKGLDWLNCDCTELNNPLEGLKATGQSETLGTLNAGDVTARKDCK